MLTNKEVVTRAENIETMMTPVIMHKMQNTRPRGDFGDRSPYLCVTNIHNSALNAGEQSEMAIQSIQLVHSITISKLIAWGP